MIFDCFTFFNEHECLAIRMAELKDLDVIHIAVQGNKTFKGEEKNFVILPENERLISLLITDMPDGDDPWKREKHQRDSIMLGLKECGAKDDDLVIIGDADEIPFARAIKEYNPSMGVTALVMNKTGYWFNCIEGWQSWKIAKIMTYGRLKQSSPDQVRNAGNDNEIQNAGWHFSWLGDVNRVVEKFNSFSHQDENTQKFNNKEELKRKIEVGESLWGNDGWEIVKIDERFPEEIRNNISKYKHLIHGGV